MKKKLLCGFISLLLLFQPVFASEVPADNSIKIAVIDTGISAAAITDGKVEQGYNYILDNTDTEDRIGHGTAIAGIIVGSSSGKVTGIAPDARLIPLVCQTKDADGRVQKGTPEVIARAVRNAVDVYGCRIINLSLGTTEDNAILREAIEYAEEKNAVVISAVGNENKRKPENLYYPAAYSTVIGVGSVDKKGKVSNFSQRNSSVLLAAPGEKIWTVSQNGNPLLVSGTSYAAAYVSGAAATLLTTFPELTATGVRRILCDYTEDICETGYDTDSGWGIIRFP